MDIAWHEVGEKICTSNNSTMQSHIIGGKVSFGSSYQIPGGPGVQASADVNWNISTNITAMYSINAPGEVKVGVLEISYCSTPNGTFDYNKIEPS